MNYDNPKDIQIIPPYAEVRNFNEIARKECANNDFAGQQNQPEAPDMGGYLAYGTSANASGTSIAVYPVFTPREGPIPSWEVQKQHEANWLSIKPELKTNG